MPDSINSSITISNGDQIYTQNATQTTVTINLLRSLVYFLAERGTAVPKYLGYGSGDSKPYPTDTSLSNEFVFGLYMRVLLYNVDVRINASNEAEITFIFVDETNAEYENIKELGIFQSGLEHSTDCVARTVLETPVTKSATNSLEVEWKMKFAITQSNTQ